MQFTVVGLPRRNATGFVVLVQYVRHRVSPSSARNCGMIKGASFSAGVSRPPPATCTARAARVKRTVSVSVKRKRTFSRSEGEFRRACSLEGRRAVVRIVPAARRLRRARRWLVCVFSGPKGMELICADEGSSSRVRCKFIITNSTLKKPPAPVTRRI